MTKYVIIVAGGKGMRMGSEIPKQFLEIGGKAIIIHTLEKIKKALPQAELFLVLPKAELERWKSISEGTVFEQIQVAKGGSTRFDSVKSGLTLIKSPGIVGIHDAVRPFVSIETIQTTFTKAKENGAAIPVIALKDSLRRLEEEKSISVDREEYRVVQTPQCFQSELLIESYQQDYSAEFTDDASVVESSGFKITLVEGNDDNIKITTRQDLNMANFLLKKDD